MNDSILVGRGRQITRIPREEWEHSLSESSKQIAATLNFMSEEHHFVRYFVAKMLPIIGKPLSLRFISHELNLPTTRVNVIIDDLEKHLTFLWRNDQGEVAWAYPVTVDSTPHQVTFSTGEQLYAA